MVKPINIDGNATAVVHDDLHGDNSSRKNSGKLDILVRPSPFFLFARLLTIHSILAILILLLLSVPGLFIRATENKDMVNNFKIVTILVMLVIGEIFTLVIIAKWVTEFYLLKADTVTFREGIFFKKKRVVMIRQVVEVLVDQSFFGKLFNYGTIRILTPQTAEDVMIRRIENPGKYFKILRELSLSYHEENTSKNNHHER